MQSQKILICCQNGLGDLFFGMTIAYNLAKFHPVTVYHGTGPALQKNFPYASLLKYPEENEWKNDLQRFDKIVLFYHEDTPYIKQLIYQGKPSHPDKIKIVYPYPTPHVKNKPYYQDSLIDPKVPFLNNLERFLKKEFKINPVELQTGFVFHKSTKFSAPSKKIALHVAGSHPKKNWPISKFIQLADALKASGYDPYFITKERKYFESEWQWLQDLGYQTPLFDHLEDLGLFLKDCKAVIGVDSGICHFASILGVPTVVIGKREKILRFWQPLWSKNILLTPSGLIPNVFGFRIRDRFWKHFISTKKVLKKALLILN